MGHGAIILLLELCSLALCEKSKLFDSTLSIQRSDFNDKIMDLNVLDVYYKVMGTSLCANYCMNDYNCMSFFYNHVERICQTHSVIFLTAADGIPKQSTTYFILQDETSNCPKGYNLQRKLNLCYKIHFESKVDLGSSRNRCTLSGDVLFTNFDRDNISHLLNQVNSSSVYHFKEGFYVDGSDGENQGTWKVSDGSPITYINWLKDEPQRRIGEDFLFITYEDGNTGFSDARSTWLKGVVCQRII